MSMLMFHTSLASDSTIFFMISIFLLSCVCKLLFIAYLLNVACNKFHTLSSQNVHKLNKFLAQLDNVFFAACVYRVLLYENIWITCFSSIRTL